MDLNIIDFDDTIFYCCGKYSVEYLKEQMIKNNPNIAKPSKKLDDSINILITGRGDNVRSIVRIILMYNDWEFNGGMFFSPFTQIDYIKPDYMQIYYVWAKELVDTE